jgi:pre-rRNA-processing protein TSR1
VSLHELIPVTPLTPGKPASSSSSKPHKSVSAANKHSRLQASQYRREQKRKTVLLDNKFFSTSSGGSAVPRIISVVPLIPSVSPKRWLANLLPTLGMPDEELENVLKGLGEVGSYMVRAPRFKTSLQINLLPALSTYETLDAALVSDYMVLLLSSTDEVQLEGEAVLRCLQGQVGGVDIVSCVQVNCHLQLCGCKADNRHQRINRSCHRRKT